MTLGMLETALRAKRESGKKLLLPYITGGYPSETWTSLVEGMAAAGADAIEIGIPFSDPAMDGPTIQESSTNALKAGATPSSIINGIAGLKLEVPAIAMTYYNICFRMGHERFATALKEAGFAACILPDLPLEEVGPWAEVADDVGIETIMLAAPTAPDERLVAIAERSRGFVYGIGLVGITGERNELAKSALEIARRLKDTTDKPVLIGIGVSNAEQAIEVAEVADGVIVGSAVIRHIISGEEAATPETPSAGVENAVSFVGELRTALDKLDT